MIQFKVRTVGPDSFPVNGVVEVANTAWGAESSSSFPSASAGSAITHISSPGGHADSEYSSSLSNGILRPSAPSGRHLSTGGCVVWKGASKVVKRPDGSQSRMVDLNCTFHGNSCHVRSTLSLLQHSHARILAYVSLLVLGTGTRIAHLRGIPNPS